jgi:predicted permease
VISELSLSLMLLIGAGLLIRSFQRLSNVAPGFNPEHVISMRVSPAGPKYRVKGSTPRFYEQVGERIGHLPGVRMQGAISALPLTPSVGWGGVTVEGYVPPADQPELQVDLRATTPDYFRAMEIPLEAGRFFSAHDEPDSQPVVMIDHKMAQRFWPHDDPIGKRVKFGGSGSKAPWMSIAGVVGTVRQYGLDVDGKMVLYLPEKQQSFGGLFLVARTAGDPAAMTNAMVNEIHSLDPEAPVYNIATMDQRLHDSLARRRFSMTMLGAFAAFALILAIVGIYGVMSYLVTQGTRDIGIRLALGATPRRILGMVIGQGMGLAAIGIVAGLAGAAFLTRWMASLLFGTSATDPATFSAVALLLAVVALLASYVPALRATKVDPMVALRDE